MQILFIAPTAGGKIINSFWIICVFALFIAVF
jgi:hypothetical protein